MTPGRHVSRSPEPQPITAGTKPGAPRKSPTPTGKQVSTLTKNPPPYHPMEELIGMMDEPNRSICRRIIDDHRELLQQAPGSSHNHQAWRGGYWDHIVEVMNLWVLLYRAFEGTGRLAELAPEEQFTLADGLPVLFLHDIEKPWRCLLVDGKPVLDGEGGLVIRPELADKSARKAFAERKLVEYGVVFSPQQQNAWQYVEGVRDSDYSPNDRVMRPLAALCHTCDLLSARAFYDFPRLGDNAWGLGRAAVG